MQFSFKGNINKSDRLRLKQRVEEKLEVCKAKSNLSRLITPLEETLNIQSTSTKKPLKIPGSTLMEFTNVHKKIP